MSEIAAKDWLGSVTPATRTVSLPITPLACVAVRESPYSKLMFDPDDWKCACSYSGTSREAQTAQASESTQKSDDPVSSENDCVSLVRNVGVDGFTQDYRCCRWTYGN